MYKKVPQTKFYTQTGKGIINMIGKWFNCFKIKISYMDSMFLMKAPRQKVDEDHGGEDKSKWPTHM